MARLPGFSQLVHCSEDGIDEALKGLEVPDAKTANQVLKGLARLPGKHPVAQKLLATWERQQCDISAFHYSTVLNACGRAHDWPVAVQLVAAMARQEVQTDTVVYNSAINACARAKRWVEALRFLEMLRGCELLPDTLTFNCLITACDQWQLGLELVGTMRGLRVRPDLVTYNAAMRGCQGAKQWLWALQLMNDMSQARLVKDEITYTTALSGLDQQWELAMALLQELQGTAVQADCQVYTALVSICGRASQWLQALDLFDQARKTHVACDTSMYNALISACGVGLAWEKSLELLGSLQGRADSITVSAALSACCDARQWQVALGMLGSFGQRQVGTAAFNALLGGCPWDVALALLEEMNLRRVEKDSLTFSTGIMVCERAEEWDASFHLLDLRVRSCEDQRLRHAPFAPRSFLRSLTGEALPRPLELRRLLRCCKREAPSSFRVNPLKAAPTVLQHLREDLGWQLSPVPWVKDGFRVTNWKPQMGFNRPQLTGDIYFQEATSMLPAEVLRMVVENQRAAGCRQLKVLDMCAAPGSKSTQLGSWLMTSEPCGLLVCNDPDPARTLKLEASLLRMAVVTLVTSVDGRALGDLAPGAFDAVLADVPCSCEGNVRKDASALLRACGSSKEGPAEHKEELVERQQGILQSAWRALKPGGHLVYSTCTFDYWENQGQCQRFLAQLEGAEHAPVPIDVMSCLDLPGSAGTETGAQIWPQQFDVEGFFVACFRKGAAVSADGIAADEGEGVLPLLERFNLKPLAHEEEMMIQAMADDTLGFWPSGPLAEDAMGHLWLLPRLHGSLGALDAVLRQPGLRVAQRGDGAESWVLAEDLLLLAGQRAKVRGMSNEDWAKLQATKEEGGQWSPSRLQRKVRNEAMLQAGRNRRSGAVGE